MLDIYFGLISKAKLQMFKASSEDFLYSGIYIQNVFESLCVAEKC